MIERWVEVQWRARTLEEADELVLLLETVKPLLPKDSKKEFPPPILEE